MKRLFQVLVLLVSLSHVSLPAQALLNGILVVNLEVNNNDYGQGTVFRRGQERIILTAGHVVEGAYNIEVTSRIIGDRTPAVRPRGFEGFDLASVEWRGTETLENLPVWKVPRDFNKLVKKNQNCKLIWREKDGKENVVPVNIYSITESRLFISFKDGRAFEEGMSGGALVTRPKVGKDVFLGVLFDRTEDDKGGIVFPAKYIDEKVSSRIGPIKSRTFRKAIPYLGYLGGGVVVSIGYLSNYQNAEEIYEEYRDNPQESVFANLNTGFPDRETAFQASEDLRKKALRMYMIGGGMAIGSALYQLLTKPPEKSGATSPAVRLRPTDIGLSLTYTF